MSDQMICPYCNELIETTAKACPHCGSDEKTGWSSHTYMDNIDMMEDFDYDKAYENEFEENKIKFDWKKIVVIFLLLVFLITTFAVI